MFIKKSSPMFMCGSIFLATLTHTFHVYTLIAFLHHWDFVIQYMKLLPLKSTVRKAALAKLVFSPLK